MKQPIKEDYTTDGIYNIIGYITALENYIEYLKQVQINKIILDQ